MTRSSSDVARGGPAVMPAAEPEAPTRSLGPATGDASGRGSRGRGDPSASGDETEVQLRQITASRVKSAVLVLLGIVPVGFVSVWFARAPWVAAMGAVAVLFETAGLLALRHFGSNAQNRLDRRRYHATALVMGLAAAPLIYALGTYTGFAGVVAMFVLLYSMGAPFANAARLTCAVAVPHVLLHVAIVMGWIEDLGVLVVDAPGARGVLSIFGVSSVYVLAVVAGQGIRRRTEKTLVELRHAAHQIAMREAMLREARLALQEAGGVGQTGRFTDQQLGRFVLGPLLGRGGMGEIYEARDVKSDEPAAVKLLRIRNIDNDKAWQRFDREAEIVASLSSPHVVRVLDVGGRDTEFPYIAMERLGGKDLAQLLRERPYLDRHAVAEMVRHVSEGLAAAHELNIVHRDVKPPNVFRCDDGTWKVLDFGVARLFGGNQTLTGGLVGTPAYMAPEQLGGGHELDHRTDLHALAVVSYRALTGHPAFHGREVAAVLRQITSELPVAPTIGEPSNRDIDDAVADVLRVALAKRPNDRFDNIREFARHLTDALERGIVPFDIHRRASDLNHHLPWATRR